MIESKAIRNAWYMAGWSRELGRRPLGRRLLGEPVALFRDSEGVAHALRAECPHRHGDLSRGRVVGDCIECPYHGWRFAAGGRCERVPSLEAGGTLKVARVPAYPLQEDAGVLWIWMGEPAEVTERLPGAELYAASARRTHTPSRPRLVRTSALAVLENTLDETHPHFAHTLGGDEPTVIPRREVEYLPDRRGLYFDIDVGKEHEYTDRRRGSFLTRVINGSKPLRSYRVGFELGGLVYFHQVDVEGGETLFSLNATPADPEQTWFFTDYSYAPGGLLRATATRWLQYKNDWEDVALLESLLGEIQPEGAELSVPADHPGLCLRGLYREWLSREQAGA